MQLLAPDILAEARTLSAGLLAAGLALGVLLWVFGWWGHRFWIVLFATAGAGLVGLYSGYSSHVQPIVAALLLAVTAGALALPLARMLAFLAGGVSAWMTVRLLAPGWDEPIACVLAGGLVGLLLFRFWMMALTSFAGTLLIAYAGLSLADQLGKLNAIELTDQKTVLNNWICGGGAVLGLIVQFLLDRWRVRREKELEEEAEDDYRQRHEHRRWWNWRSNHRRVA